jgi:thiamine-phosphate pyrophosphorylase
VRVLALLVSLPNSLPLDSRPRADRKPILCYVTDRRSLQAPSQTDLLEPLLDKIAAAAAAGIDWIQLREKDLSGRDTASLTREVLQRVSKQTNPAQTATRGSLAPATHSFVPATRILVNDRLDVAIAAQAAGVHLGENSLPVQEVKRLLLVSPRPQSPSQDFLVGASCHSLKLALSAANAGADYIFFGPVFATPSKAAFGPPQGLHQLAEVCHSLPIPVLAIGGITLANAPSCFSSGASGIAAVRLFQDSADPAAIVRALRQISL